MDIQKQIKLFKNPDNSYRGKPFWCWNGSLKEEELIRQIDIMKEMGFGGYFMHSRTGLETEYLGEKWFEFCRRCTDYGEDIQMESWLYDEDRWPSGTAGGIVTKEEKYRAMFLEMKQFEPEGFQSYRWNDNTAAVFACRLDGIFYDKERKLAPEEHVNDGEKIIVFETRYSECKDFYNGSAYLDTMNREGVETYIEVTHQAYQNHCGERVGTTIKGIFTDEPHRGAMFSDFSEGRETAVPYTPQFFGEFRRQFGYSLEENLLGLFLRKKEYPLSKVSADYIELCQRLFLQNFAMPIGNWCRQNHMIFTGHVLHEDSLSAQTVMQGSLMRFYEYMDYPGIDVLTESNACWWIVKQVESVARQLDKKKILSELYGGTGWQMNFESYKNVGDWQALLGVNLRCPHLSWYTMKGEAKRDYPASILHQSGWYQEYSYLEDYFSRIHVMMSEGVSECELLVINPIESVWARSYSSAFSGLEARDPGIKAVEERYQETFRMLMRHRIDFDYGEEDIIKNHGSIKEGLFYVGICGYKKVLVTGLSTIRSSTLYLLDKFVTQGGTVIFAGEVPTYVDVCKSNAAQLLAERAVQVPFWEDALVSVCESGSEIKVVGEGAGDIFARIKTDGDHRRVMLLNMNRSREYSNLRVCFGVGEEVQRWDLRTGSVFHAESSLCEDKLYLDIDFAKGEEKMYVIPVKRDTGSKKRSGCDTPVLPKEPVFQKGSRHNFPDKMRYHLNEENIYVIDHVEILLESGTRIKSQEVLRADRALRDILDFPYRGGDMLQPWYQKKYGENQTESIHKIQMNYTFYVQEIPSEMYLVLEDLERTTQIEINGHTIAAVSAGKWIDICFDKIAIDQLYLTKGKNTLQIHQNYDETDGLEAVYLLGSFGVYSNGTGNMVISELPELLAVGDISLQGLPYYSGKVSYLMDEKIKGNLIVEQISFEGAYLKLIGKKTVMAGCAPYSGIAEDLKEIEVGLTRRNTFGPLHRLPGKAFAYGPETFMTAGEEWQEAHVLCAQGLMEMPALYEVK